MTRWAIMRPACQLCTQAYRCGRRRSAFLMRTHAFVCMLLSPMIVNLVGGLVAERVHYQSAATAACERDGFWINNFPFPRHSSLLFWNFTQPAHGNYICTIYPRGVNLWFNFAKKFLALLALCLCTHSWVEPYGCEKENLQRHCS
jgi:hypothetical protein